MPSLTARCTPSARGSGEEGTPDQVRRSTTGRESSFRLHVWVPTWRARRWNDFQVTAARRRNLHLPVDARGRAYDAPRLRELVAQRLGTATADSGRIAFDIRRAGRSLAGRRVGRLRQRHISPGNDDERGDEQDCNAQILILTFAHASCQRGKASGRSPRDLAQRANARGGAARPPAPLGTGREYLQLRPNKRTCSPGNVLFEQMLSFIPSAAGRA